MNYVGKFNILGVEARQRPTLVGNGEPGDHVAADVGDLYLDTSTGKIYACTYAAPNISSYTWTWTSQAIYDEILGGEW